MSELCKVLEELLPQRQRSQDSLSLQDSFHAHHIAISDLAAWRDSVGFMAARSAILRLSDEDFERLFPGADADTMAQRWWC